MVFFLSSFIERHMVDNYNQMTADLEVKIKQLDEQTKRQYHQSIDAVVVQNATNEQQGETERYSSTLFVIGMAVLVVSAVVASVMTIYILNRYIGPIKANYEAAKSGQVPTAATTNKPHFADTTRTAIWSNINRQPSCARPKRYKVDMK